MGHKGMMVAAAAAVAGASGLHVYLQRYEVEVAGGAPVPVLMVTRDLQLGEVITRAALDLKMLPERHIEERHIAADDLERVVGTRATCAVTSGSALLWSDLDTMQEGRTLSGLVRVGMRAFAIPEQDVSFDGLLRPGDRVDVLFVPLDGTKKVETLLVNVLVLTVGQNLGQADGELTPERRSRVTLSIAPEQSELLAQREGAGRLRLALRNPQDALVEVSPSTALPPPANGEPSGGKRAH